MCATGFGTYRRLDHWPETAFEEISMPPASPSCDASHKTSGAYSSCEWGFLDGNLVQKPGCRLEGFGRMSAPGVTRLTACAQAFSRLCNRLFDRAALCQNQSST